MAVDRLVEGKLKKKSLFLEICICLLKWRQKYRDIFHLAPSLLGYLSPPGDIWLYTVGRWSSAPPRELHLLSSYLTSFSDRPRQKQTLGFHGGPQWVSGVWPRGPRPLCREKERECVCAHMRVYMAQWHPRPFHWCTPTLNIPCAQYETLRPGPCLPFPLHPALPATRAPRSTSPAWFSPSWNVTRFLLPQVELLGQTLALAWPNIPRADSSLEPQPCPQFMVPQAAPSGAVLSPTPSFPPSPLFRDPLVIYYFLSLFLALDESLVETDELTSFASVSGTWERLSMYFVGGGGTLVLDAVTSRFPSRDFFLINLLSGGIGLSVSQEDFLL